MGVAERRQREKEQRRITILRAAEDVFVRRGVAETTMDDIARAAEVSKGTLYLYFKSKDDLYLTIATDAVSELLDALHSVPESANGFEHAESLLKAYANFAVQHRSRFRLGISWLFSGYSVPEQSEAFAQYRETIGNLFSHVASTVERGKADGSIRSDLDTAQLIVQLWAGTVGVLTVHMSSAEVARRIPRELFGESATAGGAIPLFPAALEFKGLVMSFIDSLLRCIHREAAPGASVDIIPEEEQLAEVAVQS